MVFRKMPFVFLFFLTFIGTAYCGSFRTIVTDTLDSCFQYQGYLPEWEYITPTDLFNKIDSYFSTDTGQPGFCWACFSNEKPFRFFCKEKYSLMYEAKLIEILKRDKITRGNSIYRLFYCQWTKSLEIALYGELQKKNPKKIQFRLNKAYRIIRNRFEGKPIRID